MHHRPHLHGSFSIIATMNRPAALVHQLRSASSRLQSRLQSRIPVAPTPQALGYLGATPFLVGALGSTVGLSPAIPFTQIYGAAILSFLGGTHWGLALRTSPAITTTLNPTTTTTSQSPNLYDFGLSVVPSLIAVTAAVTPPHNGLPILASSFTAWWIYERVRWYGARGSQLGVPQWYVQLRIPLSIAAIGGCAVAGLAARSARADVIISEDIPISSNDGSVDGTTAAIVVNDADVDVAKVVHDVDPETIVLKDVGQGSADIHGDEAIMREEDSEGEVVSTESGDGQDEQDE